MNNVIKTHVFVLQIVSTSYLKKKRWGNGFIVQFGDLIRNLVQGRNAFKLKKKKKKLGYGVITNKSDLTVLWKHTLMYPCTVVMVSLVFMGN